GIGTLLEDGIGDTIRVSLTEDPEFEIPVCRNIVKRYGLPPQTPPEEGLAGSQSRVNEFEDSFENQKATSTIRVSNFKIEETAKSLSTGEVFRERLPYNPFEYKRRETFEVSNIGAKHPPVVIADLHKIEKIRPGDLESIGYTYDVVTDKWNISDMAADYLFTAEQQLEFSLPGTLKVISYYNTWLASADKEKYFPIFSLDEFAASPYKHPVMNFVMLDCSNDNQFEELEKYLQFSPVGGDLEGAVVICLSSTDKNAVQSIRRMFIALIEKDIKNPVIIITDSTHKNMEESLIHYAVETGALLLDGFGDGICLGHRYSEKNIPTDNKLLNSIAFGILQATRTRISRTEYISCPSCGRTLFDLQETTARIRSVTNHLKGVKIAIMGCIVNGPGEMADADFGYVGSGPGKVTLYKGKEVVKRAVSEEVAVDELINLIKENEAWVEPTS
ncbi:MAG TPA: flavodoxin-dependent (E)-4-hydroxy-3-methylbut-2-enyl-diphosphate synthase, partial [Chitinophagaceae bacterium]|nr:flavodoxin-dependent (E)-4-hydroxy-3-methylbut-2-enyl-diphosphate synthase [Chitinophagaceae bacterium]